MVKRVVRRLHYSEEYCYGFRVGLDWKPLTSRDQYSSCAPRLNIPNRDHHLLMSPYVHSISAGRPAVPDSAPVLVFLGLLESAREQQEVVFALVISFLTIVGLVVA